MEYYFATGSGRSGTSFIAHALSTIADDGDVVRHEYIGKSREFWLLCNFVPGDVYALPYLSLEKSRIESGFKARRFVDVNPYLQNCIPEVKKAFDPKLVLGIVRDGRDVVRSFYRRRPADDVPILCDPTREEIERQLKEDKFGRICHHWAYINKELFDSGCDIVYMERLLGEYEYFQERLLAPLGYSCSRDVWQRLVRTPVKDTRPAYRRWLSAKLRGKATTTDELPHWSGWGAEARERFKRICGPTMDALGYSMEGW